MEGNARRSVSELILDERATLDVTGNFALYQGASLYVAPDAQFIVHGSSYINTNSVVNCFSRIELGKDVAISDDVRIQDSDNHHIYENGVEKPMTKPIVIGNHVWIGKNVIILKGVHIGDGCIIGAGSVVTRDVPDHCLAVGNPARVIKHDVVWK